LILVELSTITVKRFFWFFDKSKRKFEQWWSTIQPISTKQNKVLTVMVDNSTNINKTKESFNSDCQQFCWPSLLKLSFGFLISEELLTITIWTFFWFVDIGRIVDHLCLINFLLFQWWSKILPISTNQKKVWTVMVNNSSNINKQKQSFSSVGRQFYQYQQTKRMFWHWW
jgi:hypothetical protein